MSAPVEVQQFGPGPQGLVRRWLTEIQIARKNDKPWRDEAMKVWNKYKGKDVKRGAFNILWSNTEVLRPSIYNSLPQPDVRRRYGDADPLGKCVAEVLQRALQFSFECSTFDEQVQLAVLDVLLPGRGVSRVRYIPSLVQVGDTAETGREEDETDTEHEALQGPQEELAWEQVEIEHVQWDDLLLGPGKCWEEVQWIAFRHDLTRDQIGEQFGDDIASKIAMKSSAEPAVLALEETDEVRRLFDTVEVWEVWDKQQREVLFFADTWRSGPLKQVADPLKLSGFYPIPEPLRAVEDATSLLPTPMYALYREQAEELDKISIRINKIVDALKVRGIYDATLGNDISQLVRGADNDLIPAIDVASWIEKGGIDKAIWFMPIEQASAVLGQLYQQREQCKQVIYELTGISDLLRGSTQSDETATAQLLKHQWGTIRLQRLQRACQDHIRDLVRLMGELIAEHFSIDTLAAMTGLAYPRQAEVEQVMSQYHAQALIAQHQGQQPPPEPQIPPTWEQIKGVLGSDLQRTYKIDIETDSTIAATQQTDMAALSDVMGAVSKLMQELWPMVQSGALPFPAAKELVLVMVRRSRMGSAVEDALDKMQAPPPPPPDPKTQIPLQVEQLRQQGEQQRIQAEQQAKQAEIQADAQADLVRAHLDAWVAQQQQGAQAQQRAQEQMLEAQTERMRVQNEAQLEQVRLHVDSQLESLKQNMALLIAKLNNAAKIEVAEIAAGVDLATTQIAAAQQGAEE